MHIHLHFTLNPSRARSVARMGVLALLLALLIVLLVGDKPKGRAEKARTSSTPNSKPTAKLAPQRTHRHTSPRASKVREDLDAMKARFAENDRKRDEERRDMTRSLIEGMIQAEEEIEELDARWDAIRDEAQGIKWIEGEGHVVEE